MKTHWLHPGVAMDDNFGKLTEKLSAPLSPEELKRRQERFDAEQRRVHAEEVARFRRDWNAPRRQAEAQAKIEMGGPWGAKVTQLSERIGTGFFVGVVGERGAGKTQLGVQLMHAATRRGFSALYETATGVFLRFKASFRSGDETELEILEEYCRPRLLVIDEVGRRAETDWENRLFFEIIDRRYADLRDTLLVSNQTKEEFLRSIGDSLASRMSETGGVVECNWPSFRQ